MLATFSPVELVVVLALTLLTLVPIVAGAGIIVYMIVRKATRDGIRDATQTNDRAQPK